MEYKEEEYLLLSGIQHFIFCRRQWGLIHIEQLWNENFFTTDGRIMHEKAHDGLSFEKRGNVLISRGMPIASRTLGFSGTCDIVEFREDESGITLFTRPGKYKVYPVEYKRGSEKVSDCDIIQVVAQAMCLEEMLVCDIETAYIYYGKERHRFEIQINQELRDKVICISKEMHVLFKRKHTPVVKAKKECKTCSLQEKCVLGMLGKSAKQYVQSILTEDEVCENS